MPIKRLSQTSLVSFQKHSNMLAGNPAYSPPVYDLLETTVLSSSASSVTFSSLGSYSDYKHLQIRLTTRSDWSSAFNNDVYLRFNSDTGSNYSWHWLYGDGSAVYSGQASNTGRIDIKDPVPSLLVTSNVFGASVIDILDFSATTKNKTIRSLNGTHNPGETKIVFQSGLWRNTNAITELSLESSNGSFISGCRFSLYGVK